MKKRILSLLLCCVMLVGLLPTAVFAEDDSNTDTGKAILLGASGISGYDSTTGYDYIYFGNWTASGKHTTTSPIKWRVLDDKTNTGESGMFLLSDALLRGGKFDDRRPYVNAWQGSAAQAWCRDFAGEAGAQSNVSDAFTADELCAILATSKSDDEFTGSNTYSIKYLASNNILDDDKVFFLSAEEAENGNYGFADDASRLASFDTGDRATDWRLRSPTAIYGNGHAGVVSSRGEVRTLDVDIWLAFRPAFNLNSGSVLFTSAAAGGKADTAADENLTAVSDYTGNEWKLTLKDSNRSFSANVNGQTSAYAPAGGSVQITYSGAQTGENEYVSLLLCDSNDNVLYYGSIAQSSASGTASVMIPADLAAGDYTLKVFSEQCNGDKKTDYASDFQNISLTVVPDTYLISTANELKAFRDTVNGGNGDADAKLMNDIDLGGEQWTPIANYTGTFDGNGKTIGGLNVKDVQYAGLFGTLNDATVKNVTVTGYVAASGTGTNAYAGAIAAYATGSTTITGCKNYATVTTTTVAGTNSSVSYEAYAGGTVGYATGSVALNDCVNNGTVLSTIRNSDDFSVEAYIGGIAGTADGNIRFESCVNNGALSTDCKSAASNIGGIVGCAIGGAVIADCQNNGAVTGAVDHSEDPDIYYKFYITDSNAGGIVGCGVAIRITGCHNSGAIRSDSTGNYPNSTRIGGIAGFIRSDAEKAVITDCSNVAAVAGTNAFTYVRAGGIMGFVNSDSADVSFTNCYSTGAVSVASQKSEIGGIAGNITESDNGGNIVIDNCYWLTGTVESAVGSNIKGLPVNASSKSKAEFADGTVLGLLKNNRTDSPWTKTDYLAAAGLTLPLLSWQTADSHTHNQSGLFGGCTCGKRPAGTAADPYLISTAEELKAFRDTVNGGETDAHAKLMNDIDLGGEQWTPIANYTGTFDGNGKTVGGLNVKGVQYAGLFDTLSGGSVVKNLTVAGSVEASNTDESAYAGGIAARMGGNAQIIDCVNNAAVKATVNNDVDAVYTAYAGGMAGHVDGNARITGCTNNGAMVIDNIHANADIGGMAGYAEGGVVIENCLNAAELSAVARGSHYLSDGVTECDNIQSRPVAGGMVGLAKGVTVTGCYNTGAVTAKGTGDYPQQPNAGGMIGFLSGGSLTVTDCGNTGKITASRNGAGSVAGGIVGSIGGAAFTLSNCYSTGEVPSDHRNSCVGGIAGGVFTSQSTLSDCYWLTGSCGKDMGQISGNTVAVTGIEAHSKSDFADGTVLGLLKNNRTDSPWDVCGYVAAADMTLPLLHWQVLNARKYDIYITGKQITSLNQNDVLGDGKVSFTYDDVNKKGTLTLDGVNIVCNDISDDYPIDASGIENLEIVLKGENNIEAKWVAGIMADNLTFSGDGSIEISTDGYNNWPVSCDKTFTVNGGNVKISSIDYALLLDGALTVNGGTLELIASDEYGYAIDIGRNKLNVVLGDDRIMITGTNPDGSDARITAASEVDTIKAARYVKILSKYIPIVYEPGHYGEGSAVTQNKTYGEDFGLSDALFTRIGYKQIGWALSDGGNQAYGFGDIYSGNEPLTLYPVWKAEQYSITYNPNGGTIGSGNVTGYTYGVGATLPTDVTRTGYTFDGWYDNEGMAGNPVTKISNTETGDKEYWAKWEVNQYTVTLNTNGGAINGGNVTEYTYGTGTTLPTADDITYTGHTFMGWYDNEDLSGSPVTAIRDSETGNKEYWAKWEVNTYTVTLNLGGGTVSSGNVTGYTYGTGATLPTADDMTYTGHTFMGWYDNEGLAGSPVTEISNTEMGDKEYWALWEINTHTITVKPENGNWDIYIIRDYGTPIEPPFLTREGYKFNGWDKTFPTTMPDEDMTITALWLDVEAPTGEIKIGTNSWREFLSNITFGLFFKDTQTVTITAADSSGEAVTTEYLLSEKELTKAELAGKTFTAYTAPFNINPDNECVIYARLTDTSGNVTYINTDGIVLDATVPGISGIENGKTYCAAQTVTVTEKYINAVTVNGTPVTLDSDNKFTLNSAEGTQTIIVTDKAGNETTMTVTVNGGHTWSAWTKDEGTDTHTHRCTVNGCTATETKNCTGGTATCTEQATCEICGEKYGELNHDNHTDTKEWIQTETNHTQKYKCCNKIVVAEEPHEWENGVCTECGYECSHKGGTATCTEKAVCEICGEKYGELNPDNHTDTKEWIQTETNHTQKYKCCNKIVVAEEPHEWENGVCTECGYECSHKGGTATCTEKAVCEICGEKYGELNHDNHTDTKEWIQTETNHTQKYKCCNKVVIAEEPHEWENGVCTECGYECTHTGGTATCTEKAVCEICGEKYGELNHDNHTDLKHIPAKAATKTAEGNIEYWHCDGCDNYFSDAKASKKITKADTVTAKLADAKSDNKPDYGKSPKTGDKLNLALCIALMFIIGGAMIATTVVSKKKKRNEK